MTSQHLCREFDDSRITCYGKHASFVTLLSTIWRDDSLLSLISCEGLISSSQHPSQHTRQRTEIVAAMWRGGIKEEREKGKFAALPRPALGHGLTSD